MFKKILVPLDGSELSEKILAEVEDLAKIHNAQITLLTAGDFSLAPAYITEDTIKEGEARTKEASKKYLGQTADKLKENGMTVDWIYRRGQAASEIIATAKDENVDLIAMSTHGGGEVAWRLGSVAQRVVSHSPVPVMLLPVMEHKQPTLKAEWFKGA
jgi:nucleotide-binding universal stress UspA family protein